MLVVDVARDGGAHGATGRNAAIIGRFRGGPEIVSAGPNDPTPTQKQIARSIAEEEMYAHVDTLRFDEGRHEDAATLAGISQARATPLRLYMDAWLSEGGHKGPLNERTKGQYRTDVLGLEDWAKAAGVGLLIERFTRIAAGRYVTEQLLGRGMNRGTANRKINAASAYWRWLIKRGHAEVNPLQGQSLTKTGVGRSTDIPKRPFTDAEVATVIAGGPDAELTDVIHVAALSGMRIDEVYRLKVSDCAGGWFDLRRAKTPAGRRRVPIHSAVVAVVERRMTGKLPGAFLFHEPGAERAGRERSMSVSKRFGRYRQQIGVHGTIEGRRQSRVDFHSFRRWFITKARVRFDRAVVAAIVGHEVGNITNDVYSGGPDDAVRRACIESVTLPTGQVGDTKAA
jgi:integrase